MCSKVEDRVNHACYGITWFSWCNIWQCNVLLVDRKFDHLSLPFYDSLSEDTKYTNWIAGSRIFEKRCPSRGSKINDDASWIVAALFTFARSFAQYSRQDSRNLFICFNSNPHSLLSSSHSLISEFLCHNALHPSRDSLILYEYDGTYLCLFIQLLRAFSRDL